MMPVYKDDLVTQRIPEDPASVKKAKDELQALIDADAPEGDIEMQRGRINQLYRYEDDKAAGKIRSKKGIR